MRDLSNTLNGLEREIQATPVDEDERLTELLDERGRLVAMVAAGAGEEPTAETYERLLEHRAAGEDLAERLRRERALLVEAWGDSTRERQVLKMFETDAPATGFVELG